MNLQKLKMFKVGIAIALISALSMVGTVGASGLPDHATSASLPDKPLTTTLAQGFGLERIQFAPGATSAVVSGQLPAQSTVRFILGARAGQLMEVDLSAPQGASLTVTTPDGRSLAPIAGSAATFRGYLPSSGDYILAVTSGSQPGSYSIHVSIPRRVAFERGATSAVLTGYLAAHQSHDYILRGQAGQLMEIDVTSGNSLQLLIYGADGTVLGSGMGEGSNFRGLLPFSQDYLVTVRAGDQGVSFSMNVILPQLITFQRGAFSGTVSGMVSAYQSQYYVLRARQNQSMQVEVNPGGNVQLIVYGADGTVLKSGMGEGAVFTGRLPADQDYILVVRAGAIPVTYQIWAAVY